MLVVGDPENPVTIDHQHQHTVGRARVVILPDNNRPALTEAEIQTERTAIEREHMISEMPLLEAVAEDADDTNNTEQAEPEPGWQRISIKLKPPV
jgi:hypothetical protein